MEDRNWDKLEEILQLARQAGVSFSLHYEESSNEWHGEVSSAAKDENFISKTRSYNAVVDYLRDWLKGLLNEK